jgi:hypothetical protein
LVKGLDRPNQIEKARKNRSFEAVKSVTALKFGPAKIFDVACWTIVSFGCAPN